MRNDDFTRSLFYTLHMDWNEIAKAREVLNEIVPMEENIETVLGDIIFSLSIFLDFILEGKTVENNLKPFIIVEDFTYHVFIGNDDEVPFRQEAFSISDAGVNIDDINIFTFEKSKPDGSNHSIYLEGLEEIKKIILFWFKEFYEKVKEDMF